MAIHCHQLAHHSLYIRDPETSLDFYQHVLGMALHSRMTIDGQESLFLGFDAEPREQQPMLAKAPHCFLQLVFDPTHEFDNRTVAEKENRDRFI